ncbi:BgTH12-05144 [Blumeria graminis f. sp. triticale]|uniref:BgTH12-05144 n=1 Tax=Blumeria graminis f. sp. triticale TaxID=1689686 RepID=A0A9W4GF95_BLUGR|nr:BgTH12-05144 [Blumeria graminis f. sp. triticale]
MLTSFSHAILFLGVVMHAAANSVNFVNQDGTTRTIIFTSQSGQQQLNSIKVAGNSAIQQEFPQGWIGNWYSVSEGSPNVPGMLGEVRFDGFGGATYFDVSAIVNPTDNSGVKQLFPAHDNKPVSGCQNFPCANAYNKADDLQTASTPFKDLICLLGNSMNPRRRGFFGG